MPTALSSSNPLDKETDHLLVSALAASNNCNDREATLADLQHVDRAIAYDIDGQSIAVAQLPRTSSYGHQANTNLLLCALVLRVPAKLSSRSFLPGGIHIPPPHQWVGAASQLCRIVARPRFLHQGRQTRDSLHQAVQARRIVELHGTGICKKVATCPSQQAVQCMQCASFTAGS